MSETIIAPFWRRLAAIGYDAFLLAALWMVAAMAVTLLGQLLALTNSQLLMRVVMFCVGLAFFGWFWTHGGQTLGMRTWRVRVERLTGSPLRWPTALLRYMAGLLPIICALYAVARFGWATLPLALLGYAPCWFDERRRAFNDIVANTQMVLAPPRSAQSAQPEQSDEDEERGGQAG